jgi:serine/threonine-protein kinase
MEYIEGRPLKALIAEKGCIGEEEPIRYAAQVCDALEAAHAEGIIHRDVKPQNILLDSQGNVKITDFGIATSASSKEPKDSEAIGSVFYISPEQAKNEKVDRRTDIYSLGIVLYEMLTGKLPYTGEKTVAVALKHINEKITPPARVNSNISAAVNFIVLKATCKAPKDRYRSAEAFKADLLRVPQEPDGRYVDIPEALKHEPETSPYQINKIWKTAVLAALVLIVGAAIYLGFRLFGTPSELIQVADITGISVAEAKAWLESEGLIADIVYEHNETAAADTVVAQEVAEGKKVPKGTIVTLTVSDGPGGLVMPDLVGMSLEEARQKLEEMDLGPADIDYEVRADVAQGRVVSQMPEADTEIISGELVTLIVSGEAPQEGALIPSLKGLSVDQAVSLLQSMGFTSCFVYEQENAAEAGTIFNQSPVEGAQAVYSDEIMLYMSAYAQKAFSGVFRESFDVAEAGSKVQVVLVDKVNNVDVCFVVQEPDSSDTHISLDIPLTAFTGGIKTVIVYVNNVATYTYKVMFN